MTILSRQMAVSSKPIAALTKRMAILSKPASQNRGLLGGLPWPFSWFRECAYQVFHGDEADLASCAELELALHQLVASKAGRQFIRTVPVAIL